VYASMISANYHLFMHWHAMRNSEFFVYRTTNVTLDFICEGPWIVKYMSIIVQQDAHTHTHNNIQFIYICKLLYMFRMINPLIIRSSYHYTCSIWHYWDRTATCLERDWMGTGFHPITFKTGSSTVSIMPDTADTVIWARDDEWSYHSKHVEQFTNIHKLYIVASCWSIIDI
jgi:hypothetical protein